MRLTRSVPIRRQARRSALALLALGATLLVACAAPASAPAAKPAATVAPTASTPAASAVNAPAAAPARYAGPPATVKVSAFRSISDAGIYIAVENGYFAEQGVDAELTTIANAAEVVTALASGQVDVAGGSPSAGIYNAVARGVNVRVVADKGSTPPGRGYIGLALRKGLADQVRTFADLKGRPVAWAAYQSGGTNVVPLEKALAANGMGAADLQLTDLTFADAFTALANGSVDAGVLVEPLTTQAVERDVATRFLGFDELYPNQQVATLMYGAGFIERDPEAARRFMVAYLRGVRAYNDALDKHVNRDAVVATLIKHTTVKEPELYARMVFPGLNSRGLVNQAGMEEDLRLYRQLGLINDPNVTVAQVVDNSFVEHALRQLGD